MTEQPGVSGLNNCNDNKAPYIDQCGYDQAGIILQHIHGRLNPPQRGLVTGSIKRFDQSLYTKPRKPNALSLGDTGYVFIPLECEQGRACRVHVALHGCKQDVNEIGQRFVDHTGYNAWADTNRLIVLYPQTKPSSYSPTNPQACWDWWSYIDHDDSYVTKSGSQIKAIKAMLDRLTAAATTSDETATQPGMAPEELTVIDTSDVSADLVWSPLAGVATYRVSRASHDGIFQTVGEASGPSFGDFGLTPQTTYRWRVSAIVNGVEGPTSAATVATTRATPPLCNTPGSCPIDK